MDVVSHGLWGGVAFGRKNRREFLWAFFFGVMPDVASFGVFSFMRILGLATGPDWSKGLPHENVIPPYVHTLYGITHSLFVFVLVFLVFYLFKRRVFWPMFAWLLHILMDIPTHSIKFFATPFLWPVSNYRFDGFAWGTPYIFYPNLILLLAAYVVWFVYKSRVRSR